jgi:hypothetical protein
MSILDIARAPLKEIPMADVLRGRLRLRLINLGRKLASGLPGEKVISSVVHSEIRSII